MDLAFLTGDFKVGKLIESLIGKSFKTVSADVDKGYQEFATQPVQSTVPSNLILPTIITGSKAGVLYSSTCI